MKSEKSFFKNGVILLVCTWLGLFVFTPNMLVLFTSFLERDAGNFVRIRFSLEAYQTLIDPVFLSIFLESFRISMIVTLICLVAGYPFAYGIARAPRQWRRLLLVLVIIPFWTSSLVRTYALMMLMRANGLINTWLMNLGLIETPLPMLYTEGAVLLGLVYNLLPFMILPLFAAIEKMDPKLLEAAEDLGANRFQRFTRIVIPLTLPGIIAGSILVFLPAMGLFYIPDILGGSRSILVGNLIRDQFLTARNWPFGSAASVMLTLTMALMLLAYWRSMKRFNESIIR
ncbi:spermidine/putrescine ABC transporter permease PotB [Desulfobotulus sp. H1]|uniref:Spermidine/putrescine ABC transporter permease PotB n=1 Tax=Desulfobotulus pelophilus TaxID=2823377 RepID=A0ABT3NBT0_9BACT|nr:spermidine/putrescine ABC transporter permease PotB [Desulfobotulus pelophilus]MCW7754875.1 spermidine/putrescine ABC transporter permease PotB [Desulfobotulus pelophilus]